MRSNYLLIVTAVTMLLSFPKINFGQAPDLGVASTFVLFTASGAFNGDAATSIVGDIGTNAGAFTPPGLLVGSVHVPPDPIGVLAATDIMTAYADLAGRTCGLVLATPFGNQTLLPNIYCLGGASVLNGNLILDGGGDPSSLFIFQINGALSTDILSTITLTGGANFCNVYFQVNGAVDLGGNSVFRGTILAAGAISLGTGAVLDGRALSTMGAISTSANVISIGACAMGASPSITCPAAVAVSCVSQVPTANVAAVTAVTNCGGAAPTVTVAADVISGLTCANNYVITRVFTATDACGSATCAQTITVNDQTAPTVTCPASVTVTCAGSVPAANPASVVTSDGCGGAVTVTFVSDVITNQTCPSRYTITRTYQAVDACGNVATCAQTITVNDQTAPTVTCPASVTVTCASLVPAANPASVVASDGCGGAVTVVFVGDVISNQTCANRYTITRTYRATDLCGNVTTCAQIITVNDLQTAPVITCPASVMLSCSSQMPVANPASVVTTDHCGGPVTVLLVDELMTSHSCANRFTMSRIYRATDMCGNSSTCVQSIAMNDQTPPVFQVLPQNMAVECTADTDWEAELTRWLKRFGDAEVSEQCDRVFTEVRLIAELPHACGGNSSTFTRTYEFRATDACGNVNNVQATFSLVDLTPPVIICPPGNILLTCEHDIPAPDPSQVVAYDNCGGSVKLMLTISSVGTGCLGYTMSTNYWYMATDECGNMSSCDQSFQMVDSIPPLYNGPDTIQVSCVNDLPGSREVTDILAPYMTDNCSDIVCLGRFTAINGSNSVTYQVKAKDLCGNWTDKFNVTFLATGICRPLCTATQTVWGNPTGIINSMSTSEAIEGSIAEHGGVTAGKLGKTTTATSVDCVQSVLPGGGHTAQFSPPGRHVFSADNDCQPSSPLLNADGTLKNELSANVMAMQLNIWYNLRFNDRFLGVQRLATLPACLVDPIILEKMETGLVTVQGLLNLSNDYLAGVGFFPQGFGDLLNTALDNLNSYWQNCQLNDPCSAQMRQGTPAGDHLSQLRLAPNPVLDVVTLTFAATAETEWQVRFVGSSGVQSESFVPVVAGSNTVSFSTKDFPAGLYTVVLQQGKNLQTLRMVKVRE